jgi:hypothetical protein
VSFFRIVQSAAHSSETSCNIYHTALRHIPVDGSLEGRNCFEAAVVCFVVTTPRGQWHIAPGLGITTSKIFTSDVFPLFYLKQ